VTSRVLNIGEELPSPNQDWSVRDGTQNPQMLRMGKLIAQLNMLGKLRNFSPPSCIFIAYQTLMINPTNAILKRNLRISFTITSWKPVLRTDFLWTCWGLNRIEHHFEAMYPHIPVFTIVNPSPKSFLINLLPHSVTHYIGLLSSPFALPRCNNCHPIPYLPQYRPSSTKNDSTCPLVINDT
jgi:hypothetical protein